MTGVITIEQRTALRKMMLHRGEGVTLLDYQELTGFLLMLQSDREARRRCLRLASDEAAQAWCADLLVRVQTLRRSLARIHQMDGVA